MKHSARSVLMTGVVMLAVSAIALAPVRPAPPPAPAKTVRLVAAVQPLRQQQRPPILTVLPSPPRLLLAPSASAAALPSAPGALATPIAPNLANTIDNAYLAIEPWVQYGFEIAAYAVAWIPYVGFLSGLIMDAYFFGESIVASAVFNFTDFLRGDGGIVENWLISA